MKIIDNRNQNTTKSFRDIKIGDTFSKPCYNEVYMRTENLLEVYDDGFCADRYVVANAICLNNGRQIKFSDYDTVIPLNCECVITNK